MKASEFIIELKKESKPRNFVAKNAKMGGAGQHKDKKKAEKQGDVKHKKSPMPMESALRDKEDYYAKRKALDDLGRNKDVDQKAVQQRRLDLDKEAKQKGVAEATGNNFRVGQKVIYTTSNGQKFPSIVTAVDFDEDAVKIKSANNKPFPNSGGDIEIVVDPGWKFLTAEPGVDPNSIVAVSPSMRKTTERVRDPEDWDEGNTEPANNFAVSINGKKWKVFKGRGQYADDYREQAHYQQLKDWAAKKSASTGKKWTVSITGENPTESLELDEISWSGIKKGAAAAGLAGAMALGSGGAHARVTGDEDPGVNRLTGKPNVTQVAPSDSKPDSSPSLSSRYGPDYEGSPAAYTITVKGQDYKFAGRDKDGPGTGPIIKVPGGAVGIRGLSPVAVELGKDGSFYIAPK